MFEGCSHSFPQSLVLQMKKWSNPLVFVLFFPKKHSINSYFLILWSLIPSWAGINALGLATLSCTMLILNYHSNFPGAEWNSSAPRVVAALLLLFFRAQFPTEQQKRNIKPHLGVLLFFPKCQFLSETQSTGAKNILKFSKSRSHWGWKSPLRSSNPPQHCPNPVPRCHSQFWTLDNAWNFR